MYRIGVDVGGSFTDFVMVNSSAEKFYYFKVPSTPADPSVAIANGVREMLTNFDVAPTDVEFFGHGTTVATNMIIERRGATAALVTTAGFRDVLAIGRQTRPNLFDYSVSRPPALIERSLRLEIDERMSSEGSVLNPLKDADLEIVAQQLLALGVESVAICFLHSYRNNEHEVRARDVLQALLPNVYISISSEVLPEFREYERTSTTALNAYVGPRMKAYLDRLRDRVRDVGITPEPLTVHSNGGLLSLPTVERLPVLTCLSGPAAGVSGAVAIGAAAGVKNIITFDVGGTSTDVSLINDGSPYFTSNRLIADYPARLPMVDIHVIGAGGGSIAEVDSAGGLKVGPRSAGAKPGPVAYGLGGVDPTLTDANICLRRLNPIALLDGRMPIDRERSWAAIDAKIAQPLGITVEAAAHGMLQVATANMSRAIRAISAEHGVDAAGFTLMAFGGAGPLHAADVAEECGINNILIPQEPGTMCARGVLVSDISRDFVVTQLARVDADNWTGLRTSAEKMIAAGQRWLDAEKVEEASRRFVISFDARYAGQNHDIPIVCDATGSESMDQFLVKFHQTHERQYGYAIKDQIVQIVNIRVKAVGLILRNQLSASTEQRSGRNALKEGREVYFGVQDGWLDTPVYRRNELSIDSRLEGPAIIEEMSSTTVVLPRQTCTVDEIGNLCIARLT
ncbi:5-oxoprolinase [Caballeronia mineralivorans PML1(12)]|uniref:5-oxoprolinase n=2 Tax=Caballeronia mineralivorans TaxID=2010198 RepID=A0A0J1CNC8_9BURK|nr:5-oxoprolinase [Caballeronia mineralivorans PML1(12)]